MKLGEFLEKFSHNNIIRLVYKEEGGHKIVLDSWNDVSMDHDVNNGNGKNRHFINNEVLGLATITVHNSHYPEAINIVIEKLVDQPFIEEVFIHTSLNT